jgi:O-antigen ligase
MFWAVANLDTATALIGRNATLTGRTHIWSALIEQVDSDWLGYGYQAFWYSPLGEKFVLLWLAKEGFASAHNGYLELWLDLGYVGVAFFLLLVFTSLRRLIGGVLYSRGGYNLLLPALLLFFLISSIPAQLFEHNSVFWIIFVATHFNIYEPGALVKTTRQPLAWSSIEAQNIDARHKHGSL